MPGLFRYDPSDFNPGFVLPEAPVTRPRTVPLPPLPQPDVATAMTANNGVLPSSGIRVNGDVGAWLAPAPPTTAPQPNYGDGRDPLGGAVPGQPGMLSFAGGGQQPLPPLPPPVDVQPGDQTRPRYVGDETQRLIDNREKFINDPALKNAPENKPGRLASFLGMFLGGAGDAANRVLEGSARSGRPITTGDFLQAVAGGIGGGAAGAIKPKIYADMKHGAEIARLDEQKARDDARRAQKLDEEAKKAGIAHLGAQDEELRGRAQRDADKQRRKGIQDAYNKLPSFDPADPANAKLVETFENEFGFAPPKKEAGKKIQLIHNEDTSEWTQVSTDTRTGKQEVTLLSRDGVPFTTTSTGQMNNATRISEGAANRLSREQIAQQNIDARKEIARLNNENQVAIAGMPARSKAAGGDETHYVTVDQVADRAREIMATDPYGEINFNQALGRAYQEARAKKVKVLDQAPPAAVGNRAPANATGAPAAQVQ